MSALFAAFFNVCEQQVSFGLSNYRHIFCASRLWRQETKTFERVSKRHSLEWRDTITRLEEEDAGPHHRRLPNSGTSARMPRLKAIAQKGRSNHGRKFRSSLSRPQK